MKTGKKIKIKINGKKFSVPDGITVLEAARLNNIYIPTLCYLENLEPYGGCRLCIVKIKNMRGYPTACTTPVTDGMDITTNTPEINKLRKETLELILSEHPYTCLICKDKKDCIEFMHSTRKVSTTTGCNFCANNGDCELQNLVEYLELTGVKFPITYRGIEPVKDNPFYDIDYNLCILCGRCVRVCNEERNNGALSFIQRGNNTIVGTAFGRSQLEAGCGFCGACVDVCPTGSISEKIGKWSGLPDKSIKTTCLLCPVGCTMNVNSKNNRLINVGPKSSERINPPQLCVRGKFVPPEIVHHPDRVLHPLIKKGDKWIEVSWNKAINFTADKLKKYVGDNFGLIGSPHDFLEDNYVLQKFTRKVMKSNNLDLLTAYPDSEIIEKINKYNNTFQPLEIDSIKDADTILIMGSDTSVSHPIIEHRIRKASNNGSKIIFANPYENRTASSADNILIYKIGGELLLLHTFLSELVKKKKGKKTENLKLQLKKLYLSSTCEQLYISESQVKEAVSLISKAKKLLIIAGDGILRGANSIDCFNALYNLQLLQKNPGDSRIIFLLSEGNYYGSIFAGMNPGLLPGFNSIDNEKNLKKWSDHLKTKLNNNPGLSIDQMIANKGKNGIDSLFVSGNIPGNPDLSGLKFFVQQNMFLTDISKYADVFFPATSFLEARGHIINIEGKIKKIKQSIQAREEAKTPWRTLSLIAKAMKTEGFTIKKPEDIYKELQSQTDLSFSTNNKFGRNYLPVKIIPFKKGKKHTKKESLEYNYFHYSGNDLSTLIDDIKVISKNHK